MPLHGQISDTGLNRENPWTTQNPYSICNKSRPDKVCLKGTNTVSLVFSFPNINKNPRTDYICETTRFACFPGVIGRLIIKFCKSLFTYQLTLICNLTSKQSIFLSRAKLNLTTARRLTHHTMLISEFLL